MVQNCLVLPCLLISFATGVCSAVAQDDVVVDESPGAIETIEPSNAIAEIESVVASYTKSFRARDVDALLNHWTPDGVYVNQTTGERTIGHAKMRTQLEQNFASERDSELTLETGSIDLVSPNVALEYGVSIVTGEDAVPNRTEYRVVYLKRDGRWLIDRVTEEEPESTPVAVAHLQRLEWLIGEWIDADEQSAFEFTCRWTENRSHLYRTFRITTNGEVESSGLQIIGWDAAANEIRSWLFDSNGSFVRGTWKEHDDEWMVSSVATLSDGAKGSFVSVFNPQEDGTLRWKKINRVLDGKILPSVSETVVLRRLGGTAR